jgi:hypothetical protein
VAHAATLGDNFLLPVPLRHLAQVPEGSAANPFFTMAREFIASAQATPDLKA